MNKFIEKNEYIIKRNSYNWEMPLKIKVLEITKTTYRLLNCDENIFFRIKKEDFHRDHNIIEEL